MDGEIVRRDSGDLWKSPHEFEALEREVARLQQQVTELQGRGTELTIGFRRWKAEALVLRQLLTGLQIDLPAAVKMGGSLSCVTRELERILSQLSFDRSNEPLADPDQVRSLLTAYTREAIDPALEADWTTMRRFVDRWRERFARMLG